MRLTLEKPQHNKEYIGYLANSFSEGKKPLNMFQIEIFVCCPLSALSKPSFKLLNLLNSNSQHSRISKYFADINEFNLKLLLREREVMPSFIGEGTEALMIIY